MQNKITAAVAEKSWSLLDSVRTPGRFVCSENTTDAVTGAKILDMFCLATGAKGWPVSVDTMVPYLHVLLSLHGAIRQSVQPQRSFMVLETLLFLCPAGCPEALFVLLLLLLLLS